jgi:hypothetical protein
VDPTQNICVGHFFVYIHILYNTRHVLDPPHSAALLLLSLIAAVMMVLIIIGLFSVGISLIQFDRI